MRPDATTRDLPAQEGAVRPDVTTEDLLSALAALGRAVPPLTTATAPDAWRRPSPSPSPSSSSSTVSAPPRPPPRRTPSPTAPSPRPNSAPYGAGWVSAGPGRSRTHGRSAGAQAP
ncbi:hypothetical protein BJ962_003719 [Streptomyces aureorectus]|nr:hypothetical protein [Streptomyces calvus]